MGKILFMRYVLFLFAVLFAVYFPGLDGGPFSTDDQASFMIPQLQNPGLSSLKAIFVPGNHADFYPVRDFSYLIDSFLWNNSLTFMRIHQLILMCIITFLIFQILKRINIRPSLALGLTALWALHPFHVEMVIWITARKDLLALMWGLLAIYFALGPKTILYMCGAVIFFILSLGSKASLTLLPIALLFPLWITARRREFAVAMVASLIGITSALFQKWFYTEVNPMSVHWSWGLRIESSAAALGRMLLGWVNPSINAIDIDNYGEWLTYNQRFESLGIIFWVSLILLTLVCYKKKISLPLTLCFVMASVYIPVSGLVFEHNFYSTRYFEPMSIVLLFLVSFFLQERVPKFNLSAQLIFVLVLLFECFSTRQHAYAWGNDSLVRKNALAISPDSVSLRAALLGDLISNTKREDVSELQIALAKQCEATGAQDTIWFPNCHNYFRYGYIIMKEKGNFERARRYLDLYIESRQIFSPLPRIINRLEADYALITVRVTPELIKMWVREKYLPTEEYRWIHFVFVCLDNPARAKAQFDRWKEERLVVASHFIQFSKGLAPNIQNSTVDCF